MIFFTKTENFSTDVYARANIGDAQHRSFEKNYIIYKQPHETTSRKLYKDYLPLQREFVLTKDARIAINKSDNSKVVNETNKLLNIIHDILLSFHQSGLDLSSAPPIRAFNLDDGSILIEWIFDDFRIGFSIEPISIESSWYLVTNKKYGEINASGYISDIDLNSVLMCVLSFGIIYVINS